MEVDDRPMSVKLTQREQGPAICSKVNGKDTRWGGVACVNTVQRGWRGRKWGKDGGLCGRRMEVEVESTDRAVIRDLIKLVNEEMADGSGEE